MESEMRGIRLEQVVDWRAATVAGLLAGLIFLPLQMLGRALVTGGSIWIFPRFVGAIVLGEGALPPPANFDLGIVAVALILHLALSLLYALILAAIIHEWTLWVGIIVGGLYGFALYVINFYAFSRLFPWFYPIESWGELVAVDVAAHVLFGVVAGGVYELLEIERYVAEA